MNMNDKVSVTLTKKGADILNKREEYNSKIIPRYEKMTWNEGDQYTTQLWILFEIFGRYIDLACETPFKDNEIVSME